MISYYLVDPDQDSSKYQKLGEIAESKFKNLENRKRIVLKKNTTEVEHHQEMKNLSKKNLAWLFIKRFQQLESFESKDLKKLI